MPVNTTANTASAVSVPTPCTAAGATDSSATAPICSAVNCVGAEPVRVRADVHDVEREQHRAREREELAPPEVHVGAGEQVEPDGRDDDPRQHRRARHAAD